MTTLESNSNNTNSRSRGFVRQMRAGRFTAAIFATIVSLSVASPEVEGQSLEWARRAGGPSFDAGSAISVDPTGSSHVTGHFTGTATFGPGEGNPVTLTSGGSDVFVAKYDNGAFSWVQQATSPNARGQAIAVDGEGNSYVTGYFRFSLDFPGTGVQLTQTLPGVQDLFVAKYSTTGSLAWARQAGLNFVPGVINVGKDAFGIAVDSAGNSYVTGQFGTELGEVALFVAKYSTTGNLLWTRHAGNDGVNSSSASGVAISLDSAGNSYVSGHFQGSITFGPGEGNQTILSSTGPALFLAKYDGTGTLLWAKQTIGSADGRGVSVDTNGNAHVTGSFAGTVVFGNGEVNQTSLSSVFVDIFVAKYSTNRNLIWAKQSNGPYLASGRGISVDSAGNAYVAGVFGSVGGNAGEAISVTFGMGEVHQTTLTSAIGSGTEIFLARYRNDSVPPPPPCAVDASAQVTVTRGGFRRNAATGRYVQQLTVRNTGATPIPGPVSLVVDNLSGNASLFNSSGNTACAMPVGPYVRVNVPAGLGAGQSAIVSLEFTNPTNQGIAYTTRVLSGTSN